ncbi:MAG: hypothetical protein HYX51_07785 [Chloroflexi bacterium]|nr:hypothetical protein [Chloroflexota bacterium]
MIRMLCAIAVAVVMLAVSGSAAIWTTAEVSPLVPGCNQVVSAFADGTSVAAVAAGVAPAGAVRAIWRQNTASQQLEGWSPAGEAVSDLRVVNRLDPLWLCVSAAGQFRQPDVGGPSVSLHCTARTLPVGRSVNSWSVECALIGAPSGDTSFEVVSFTPDGRSLCRGALAGGAGACGGVLSVILDEPSRPLRFYARTLPSATPAADENPDVRSLRG